MIIQLHIFHVYYTVATSTADRSFSAMLSFTTHQCTIQCDASMGALVSPFFML